MQLASEVQSSLVAFWTPDRLTGLTAALVELMMITVWGKCGKCGKCERREV